MEIQLHFRVKLPIKIVLKPLNMAKRIFLFKSEYVELISAPVFGINVNGVTLQGKV